MLHRWCWFDDLRCAQTLQMLTNLLALFLLTLLIAAAHLSAETIDKNVNIIDKLEPIKAKHGNNPEDSIPVIEIRGEGKPMTAAQIRALEEESDGHPPDIKLKHTWKPAECPRKAKRKDFVTFHYKCYLEDGKKVDQSMQFTIECSYGRQPIRIQLGVGMTLPGLDKGLKGTCDSELINIKVPWRLARKHKSKHWRGIPNEEHWLHFDVEVLKVEPWTAQLQHALMDDNSDQLLTAKEVEKHIEKMRLDFGKQMPSADIDAVLLAKAFVSHFDANNDSAVSSSEYSTQMQRELEKSKKMQAANKSRDGKFKRARDPGPAWILDFDNSGFVTQEELVAAPDILDSQVYHTAVQEFLNAKQNHSRVKLNSKSEL